MRNRKIFIVIFLSSFLLGCFSVLLTKIPSAPARSEKPRTNEVKKDNPFLELAKRKVETEILEENNDWETEEKFKTKLIETGEGFHNDEIEAKSGETWLGLFKGSDGYFLRKTKIKVKLVNDPIVDEPGEKTGKSVSTNIKNTSLFLLKNAETLREGSVAKLYDGEWNRDEETGEPIQKGDELRSGFVREFQMNGETYILRVKSGKNKKNETIFALVLEGEGKSQTLHSLQYFDEGENYLGELYWVGDLDNDDKPDFYLDLFFHENATYRNLFISSKARKGKLVKKVASFSTVGC